MKDQLFYPHIHWNSFKKFLMRFTLIFFCLMILPVLSLIGDELYPWIAQTVFSINEISIEPSGSGDMYYNYMELFVCFILALIASVIWSMFNKKDRDYDTLLHYFLVFIRYFIALSMLGYGFAKVFYNQFGTPGLGRLLQSYGDSSPMGIAWTFIGASKPYTVFSGLAEILGGVLILFRRTTLIGALISFAVMFNVMMINFCYDVPVKLYSTELVILCLIVVVCNGQNFWNAVWSNKAMEPMSHKPLFEKKGLRISRLVLKGMALFALIVLNGFQQYQSVYDNGPDAPKAPLYGIYKPTQLVHNNDTMRLYSDSTQWKYLVVEYEGYAAVKQINDRKIQLDFRVDTLKKSIAINETTDTLHKYTLNYKALNDTTLQLSGIYKKDTINYTLEKMNLNSFRLINRGFHWVNEMPYNR